MSQLERKTTRLLDYDYTQAGVYFFTVCVKEWKRVLGEVVGEDVVLTKEGEIVQAAWNELPEHYEDIKLDAYVVMPNHVHGIVWIIEAKETRVGEGLRPSPTKKTKRHGLPEIVRAFKSFSARKINELRCTQGQPFWQRSFYDHIIRDDEDLYNHRKYIQENPLKWSLDEYYREIPYG
jgi:putative transposase